MLYMIVIAFNIKSSSPVLWAYFVNKFLCVRVSFDTELKSNMALRENNMKHSKSVCLEQNSSSSVGELDVLYSFWYSAPCRVNVSLNWKFNFVSWYKRQYKMPVLVNKSVRWFFRHPFLVQRNIWVQGQFNCCCVEYQ